MNSEQLEQIKQLQASLSKMQVALEAIAEVVVWVGEDDRIQWHNLGFEGLVQRPSSQIIGSRFSEILPLKQAGQAIEIEAYPHTRIHKGEYETRNYEFAQGDNFRTLQIFGKCAGITGDKSAVLVIQEISQSKPENNFVRKSEKPLQSNEELLRTLINASPDIMCFKDGEGRWLESNQANLKFLGLEGIAYQGKTDAELASLSNFYKNIVLNCSQTDEVAWQKGSMHRFEEIVPHLDGKVSTFDMIKVPLFDLDGKRKGLVILGRDISDRKLAEEALIKSEERLRLSLEAGRMGIWDWNIITNELAWSDNLEPIHGLPLGSFGGTFAAFLEIVHPEDRESLINVITSTAKTGGNYSHEFRIVWPDGSIHWMLGKGQTFCDPTGKAVRMLGLGMDITDRKLAESALRVSEAQYRDLVQTTNSIIIRWDINGKIRFINEYGQNFFGFDVNELVGNTVFETIVPETETSGRNLHHLIADLCQYPENYLRHEHENICKNGKRVWIVWANKPILDQQGNLLEILSVGTDATERKQTQEELESSLSLIRAAFESIQDGILAIDSSGNILSYNQKFLDMWSIPPEVLAEPELAKRIVYIANQVKDTEIFLQKIKALYATPDAYINDVLELKDGRVFERYSCPQKLGANILGRVWSFRDISSRKQAEDALRLSEAKLRALYESLSVAIVLGNEDGIFDINSAAEKMFGCSRQEIVGKHASKISPPFQPNGQDSYTLANQTIAIAIEQGSHTFEWIHRRADGTDFPTQVCLTAVQVGENRLVQAIIQDLSERKKVEAALQERANLAAFRAEVGSALAQSDSLQAILHRCTKATVKYLHAAFVRIWTFDPQAEILELQAWAGSSTVFDSHYSRVPINQFLIAQTHQPYFTNTILADPHLVYEDWAMQENMVAFAGYPLMLQEQLMGVFVMYTQSELSELTLQALAFAAKEIALGIKRKLTEMALQRSELKYRNIFENSLVGIGRSRLEDGLFLDINQPCAEIIGFDCVHDLIDKRHAPEFHVNVDDRAWLLSQIEQYGEVRNFEIQLRRRDGSLTWGLMSARANLEESCLEFMIVDISDRKLAEEALLIAKEAAETANRSKSVFLANMSHELRTPLNAILGFAQLMERDTALSSKQRESLATINRSGEHLLNLIDDVLEMSKIEAGRIVFNPESFDLFLLLQTLQEMFLIRAQAKQLFLKFEIAPDLPRYIHTDEGKLRQVLINLLGNAVKFTQSGGLTLRAYLGNRDWGLGTRNKEILVPDIQSPIPSPPFLHFEVEDTGCGIAPQEMDNLFKPFVQTSSGVQIKEGTGLGLTISRQFIQMMGGEIHCTSTLGQGSNFSFYVQVTLTQPLEVATNLNSGRVLQLAPNQPIYRILVVDDRKENSELIVQLLSSVGFEVETATNGEEAVEMWQTWQPQLIFMDMRMPVMNGYEATREIRAKETENFSKFSGHTIIIALTASAFEEQKATILTAGCDDLIRKPFREQVIFEKIAEHLGVNYIYAPPATQTQESYSGVQENLEFLALVKIMPAQWITQLRQAALEVDGDRILQLIKQIPETHTSLAEALTNLVRRFCFDEILELTEHKQDQASQ